MWKMHGLNNPKTLYLGHNAHPLHFLNCVEISYEKNSTLHEDPCTLPPSLGYQRRSSGNVNMWRATRTLYVRNKLVCYIT